MKKKHEPRQPFAKRKCLYEAPWGHPEGNLWGNPWGNPWGNSWGQFWGQPWESLEDNQIHSLEKIYEGNHEDDFEVEYKKYFRHFKKTIDLGLNQDQCFLINEKTQNVKHQYSRLFSCGNSLNTSEEITKT